MTVTPSHRRQRHAVGVEVGVALLLPALDVERLAEVAVLVEEPDADERDAEVGRRLQVVAGEHAEAAGVLRQRLGDAELGREVGDRGAAGSRPRGLEPPRLRQVVLQLGVHLVEERAGSRGRRPARRTARARRGPSSRTGSWIDASHCPGSTQRNRSRVCSSQLHRRFRASASRVASSGGRAGRTVKLRSAFIRDEAREP